MLELHHRISSDHSFERSHLGQIGDQNFRHAVDQVFLLRISRKIHQRQNRQGLDLGLIRAARGPVRAAEPEESGAGHQSHDHNSKQDELLQRNPARRH